MISIEISMQYTKYINIFILYFATLDERKLLVLEWADKQAEFQSTCQKGPPPGFGMQRIIFGIFHSQVERRSALTDLKGVCVS